MVKRVLILFVILIVGLFLLRYMIMPQIETTLAIANIGIWTGVKTFLLFLPLLALFALLIMFVLGVIRSGREE